MKPVANRCVHPDRIAVIILGAVALALIVAAAGATARTDSTLIQDKGKFKISINGAALGSEEFDIRPNGDHWIAQATADIRLPGGQPVHVTSHLTLQPNGTPVSYDWSTQGAKKASSEVQFQNTVAMITLHLENARPYTQQFTFSSPMVAILDNNLYHQYEILSRLYDRDKKGSQTFSVLIPQEMTPGSVTVDSINPSGPGNPAEMLRVQTPDLEVDLSIDAKGRLVRLFAPAANAEVVRE
jgi:hypothetical protein